MGRLAQGRGAWQVGTPVGTFRDIKQLVETQQLKILVLVLPELPALAYFSVSFTASLFISVFHYSSPPLSPTSQRVVTDPLLMGRVFFFPV